MNKKPIGSSTPNYYPHLTRRRGVHSYNNDEEFSPVVLNRSGTASPQTRSPRAKRHDFHHSGSDLEETDESDDEKKEEDKSGSYQNSSGSANFSKSPKFYIGEVAYIPEAAVRQQQEEKEAVSVVMENKGMIALVIFVLGIVALSVTSKNAAPVSLEDIKKEFPLQDQDFWFAVDSGLQEVIRFDKPSVFLFLYKPEGERTTERLLTNISTYASCILNNCEEKPIILSSEELRHNENLKTDVGYLLTTYKTDLETGHVMIVKNLEKLPGYVARILHSFCDEISPAVSKSVFFFTVKVPEFPKTELKYVKSLLKEKWHDIKEDHFEPLFTRISGMILPVRS